MNSCSVDGYCQQFFLCFLMWRDVEVQSSEDCVLTHKNNFNIKLNLNSLRRALKGFRERRYGQEPREAEGSFEGETA